MLRDLDRYLAGNEAKRYGMSRLELRRARFIVRRFMDGMPLIGVSVLINILKPLLYVQVKYFIQDHLKYFISKFIYINVIV